MKTEYGRRLSQSTRIRFPVQRTRQFFQRSTWLTQENPLERLGRFWWVRGLYSQLRSLQQRLFPTSPCYRPQPNALTLFPEVDAAFVDAAIAQLERNAIAQGLTLPPQTTAAILDYARSARCLEPGQDHTFLINEIEASHLNGTRVYRGLVESPEACAEIQDIIHDPALLDIVHRYLRYWPTRITAHLTWSLANPAPLHEVQAIYPPTRYHYDIAGFNFMTVYFYITPVQKSDDGAHIMIPGTHQHKPPALMRSGNHSDRVIDRHFGLHHATPILGAAGFGFIQDPSCIHRLHPPRTRHRLLFQLRYS